MYFSKDYKKALVGLRHDIDSVKQEITLLKKNIRSDVENLRKEFRELILFVEESNIAEQDRQEEISELKAEVAALRENFAAQYQRDISDLKEEDVAALKKSVADKKYVPPESDFAEKEKIQYQHNISELKKDIGSVRETVTDILRWTQTAHQEFNKIIRGEMNEAKKEINNKITYAVSRLKS